MGSPMEVKINNEILKKLRLDKSWSQEKFAEMAGLSLRTIQRVETTGMSSLQTRLAIARTLGVDPTFFDLETDVPEITKTRFSFLLNINTLLTIFLMAVALTGMLGLLAGVRTFALSAMADLLILFAICITTTLALNSVGGKAIRMVGYVNAILLCTPVVVVFLYSFAPSESLFGQDMFWQMIIPGVIGLSVFAGLEKVRGNQIKGFEKAT